MLFCREFSKAAAYEYQKKHGDTTTYDNRESRRYKQRSSWTVSGLTYYCASSSYARIVVEFLEHVR
jgi:hypothetical protein